MTVNGKSISKLSDAMNAMRKPDARLISAKEGREKVLRDYGFDPGWSH
jgi:hypothetical protein